MLNFKIATLILLAATAQIAFADSAYNADNTSVNKRDQSDTTLTPMDQSKGSKRDVELTRKIRQAIVKDKAMSSYAKNIKIITLSGKATLRGPVENSEEKTRIEGLASRVSGIASVDNQLEVKTVQQ